MGSVRGQESRCAGRRERLAPRDRALAKVAAAGESLSYTLGLARGHNYGVEANLDGIKASRRRRGIEARP